MSGGRARMMVGVALVAGGAIIAVVVTAVVSTRAREVAPGVARAAHVVPASIAHDCSRDVTPDLLAWIRSVPDDSTLAFNRGDCYRVEGLLQIYERHGLEFVGNGATFRQDTTGAGTAPPSTPPDPGLALQWPLNRGMWFFEGGSDLTLRDVTLVGPAGRNGLPPVGAFAEGFHPQWAGQAAISIRGVQDATVEGVTAHDVYGDCVFLFGPHGRAATLARYASRNVVIRGNVFDRCGRHGVGLVNVVEADISRNHIAESSFDSFDIEPLPSCIVQRVVIDGNDLGRASFYTIGSQTGEATVGDISFTNNTVRGYSLFILFNNNGPYSRNYTISGNRGDTPHDSASSAPMRFVNISAVSVKGNYQPVHGAVPGAYLGAAVKLENVQGAAITGNVFPRVVNPLLPHAGAVGVYVADAATTGVTHCGNITSVGGLPPPSDGPCPS